MKRDPPSRAWVERRYPPRWAESLLEAGAAHSDPGWSYRSGYNPADSRFQRHPYRPYIYSSDVTEILLAPLPSQFKNRQFSKSIALSVNRSCIIKGEAESCVARKGCEHRGPGGESRVCRWAAVWGETPRGCENGPQRCPGRITGAWASQGSLPPATPVSQIRKGAPRGARISQSCKAFAAGPDVSSFTCSIGTRRKTEPRLPSTTPWKYVYQNSFSTCAYLWPCRITTYFSEYQGRRGNGSSSEFYS